METTKLFHLGYVSTQTREMHSEDLLNILQIARKNNAALDVTGMLLHRDDSFFQVLEGNETSVREIFSRITADARHEKIETLFEENLAQREFSSWRMGFQQLDSIDIASVPGLDKVLSPDVSTTELFHELPKVRKLLHLFRNMA